MLVNKIMKILKNLFGLNKKISASEIAFKDINNSVFTLDQYLINMGTYSTEEQRIGTWIDGKPLYRKYIGNTGSVASSNSKIFDISILNINLITQFKGFVFYEGRYVSGLNRVVYYYDKSTQTIVIYCSDMAITDCYLTIEYTKTTD